MPSPFSTFCDFETSSVEQYCAFSLKCSEYAMQGVLVASSALTTFEARISTPPQSSSISTGSFTRYKYNATSKGAVWAPKTSSPTPVPPTSCSSASALIIVPSQLCGLDGKPLTAGVKTIWDTRTHYSACLIASLHSTDGESSS